MSNVSIPTGRSAATEPGAPTRGGLSSALVLALGTFAVGTDAFIVAGFLPSMAADLRVSSATAGQSITVFAAAYAVLSPVLATLLARLPRRTLLIGALVTLGIANLGSALAPDMAVLIATRVLAAAGAAAYTPNAGAVSAALVRPELRARALAVVVGGLTIATALGVPLGSVAEHWFGWRTALGLVAGLCLLVAVIVRLIMPRLPGSPRVPLRTRLAVLRRPAVLTVLPLTVIGMGAGYTAYAYSVPVLEGVKVPEGAILGMLFLYGLGSVVGNLASGYATDRWGSAKVLTAGYTAMALALGSLAWLAAAEADVQPLVGALVLLWGAASWCQTPPQQHRLIEVAPQEAPLVVSLNASSIYLGIGLGTVIGGATLAAGAATVYGLGAALAAAALLFLLSTAGRRG
ncbi:Predicted arabinose efflux permease, MFS family [Sinosporangium album]|uniref:Predicted arabinose efflux permease, MFS family n=1 Tax=Sinosporangium album TaxID=504805 RepID=A0A1G8GEQ2_9ACTN|nr:MFS transporter [Sinosporangium album]SDH92848.1 Predicted arabinose efflux permease, MFS family [Sinosporangium album]